jgi:hypothetical protein
VSPRDRPDPRRRWRVAGSVLVLLIAVAAIVLLSGGNSESPRSSEPSVSLPSLPAVVGTRASTPPSLPALIAPVDAGQLAAAKSAAAAFLAGYLPYLYGHAPVRAISHLSAGLRADLAAHPARVTPAQHARHPRLVALSAVGRQPRDVLATATIADGSGVPYAIRLILERHHGRWLVSATPS